MNDKKLDFLKNHIGFKIEDLPQKRQLELRAYKQPEEWIYAALGRKQLKDWVDYGFGLFRDFDFVSEVNSYLKEIEDDDDTNYERKPITLSSVGRDKVKTLNIGELVEYPRSVWEWIDDDHIQSKITNHIFTVYGGKATYDKIFNKETEIKINTACKYFYGYHEPEKKKMWIPVYADYRVKPVVSLEWHKLTDFRNIKEVYEGARAIYDIWVREGKIPKDKLVEYSEEWGTIENKIKTEASKEALSEIWDSLELKLEVK